MRRERVLTRWEFFRLNAEKSWLVAHLVTVSLAGVGIVKLAAEHAWLTNFLNATLVASITTMNGLGASSRYKAYTGEVDSDTRQHFERLYLGHCTERMAYLFAVTFLFAGYAYLLFSDEVRTETFTPDAQTWLDVAAVFAVVTPQVLTLAAMGELTYRLYWDDAQKRKRPEGARLVGSGASAVARKASEGAKNILDALREYGEVERDSQATYDDTLAAIDSGDTSAVREKIAIHKRGLRLCHDKITLEARRLGGEHRSLPGDGDTKESSVAAAGAGMGGE